jgi:hypothetical protein
MEKFRQLKEYPNYLISNQGKILSLEKGIWLKPRATNGDRHVQVCLTTNKKRKWMYVHRLVALAFIKKPNKYINLVMHKDDNPKNNNVDNLQWGTQYLNMQQRFNYPAQRNKNIRNTFYQQRKTYKGTIVSLIKEIAKEFNVSYSSVCAVIYKKV